MEEKNRRNGTNGFVQEEIGQMNEEKEENSKI